MIDWLLELFTGDSVSSSGSSGGRTRNVCGYDFKFVETLDPLRDWSGGVQLFWPDEHPEYGVKHDWGHGPFCKFKLNRAGHTAGVYLWVIDGNIVYIGETSDLYERFSSGYGNISPRNCYFGGQEQNCRMNTVVMNAYSSGSHIDIWFYATSRHKQVEAELRNKTYRIQQSMNFI